MNWIPILTLAICPLFPQETATETKSFPLDGWNPEVALAMLKSQHADLAEFSVEDGKLVVEGSAEDLATIETVWQRIKANQAGQAKVLPDPESVMPLALDGQPVNLLIILEWYAEDTGISLFADEQSKLRLENTKVEIPGTDSLKQEFAVHHIESLVATAGGTLQVQLADGKRSLSVNLGQRYLTVAIGASLFVPAERVHEYGNHPALQVTTVLHCPNTDVRSASNTMRQTITNPNTEMLIPIGSSNSFLISGSGAWVHGIAQAMRLADEFRGDSMAKAALKRTPVYEVLRLEHHTAAELAKVLEDFVKPMPGENTKEANTRKARDRVGGKSQAIDASAFRVAADARTNSLLISCLPAEMTIIKDLVAALDVKK